MLPRQNRKGKGGRNRRRGPKRSKVGVNELILKAEHEEYGHVDALLGSENVKVVCADGRTRVCHIRGNMKKRCWINLGDIVLIAIREYEDGKGDVILKYSAEQARALQKNGQLAESMKINEDLASRLEDHDDKEDVFDFDTI